METIDERFIFYVIQLLQWQMSDFTLNLNLEESLTFLGIMDRKVNAELDRYITSARAENQSSSGLEGKNRDLQTSSILNSFKFTPFSHSASGVQPGKVCIFLGFKDYVQDMTSKEKTKKFISCSDWSINIPELKVLKVVESASLMKEL